MDLEISNLSKTYSNGVRALNDVTMTIQKGNVRVAGTQRSRQIDADADDRHIAGSRLRPDPARDLDVLKNQPEVRKVLGYLPQEFGVYLKVSPRLMLDHIALLKGVTNKSERRELVDAMLNRVNLYQHRKKAIAGFSGGMKQRFGIAQALLGDPKLVIVDEPTAGLDPGERNRFYNLLSEIGENVIVILSTHIVQDVKGLCTQMAIIHEGELRFAGSPADAETELSGKVWQKSVAKSELANIKEQHQVLSSKLVAGRPLVHIFSEQNPGEGFEPIAPDLEDVFFSSVNLNLASG